MKIKAIRYTGVLVAIFVLIFIWGLVSDAEATELRIGVGAGTFNIQGAVYQELAIMTDDRHWYAAVTRIGDRDSANGDFTRFTGGYRVNWRRDQKVSPYLRLGMAYFNDEPTDYISDQYSFDMGLGVRLWGAVELEAQHNSTAGRTNENQGMDAVLLTLVLPFGSSR